MTRRRWIADEHSSDHAAITGGHALHLSRVLRARVGQECDIAVDGVVRRGTISRIQDDRVEFALGAEVLSATIANVTLALSIFKFDRMEWALEKCTELGVARIIPILAHRSDSGLALAAGKRVARWRRIAQQASEQSRRTIATEIAEPAKVQALFEISADRRIVLSEVEDAVSLKDALREYVPGQQIMLGFGPEGGWTQKELDSFHSAGWQSASLGSTILRSETAAIAATAVVMAETE